MDPNKTEGNACLPSFPAPENLGIELTPPPESG